MIDIAAWQRQMNALKQVPVSVARILVKGGLGAIAHAQNMSQQPWYRPNLPGEQSRAGVASKLKTHEEQINKIPDQYEMYSNGDDLKKQVLAAYVEENAAEEGRGWAEAAWSQMWNEIAVAIAALPATIGRKINETTSGLLGIPGWAVGLGAVGLVGLLGYVYVSTIAKGHSRALGGR
jgi:hypothetical protein